MILGYRKLELHTICENTILLTGHIWNSLPNRCLVGYS